MPDAPFRNLFFVETLGQAWSAYVPVVAASWSSVATGSAESSPATVIDVGPNRALFHQIRLPASGIIQEWYWVILSIPAGGQIPLRYALEDPGMTSVLNQGVGVPFMLSDYPGLFDTYVRDAKAAVLEDITPGVAGTVATLIAQAYSDQIFTYTGVVPIFATDCSGVSLDVFRIAEAGAITGFDQMTIGAPAQPPASPAVGIMGLGGLVDAIQEITDQDMEVSINQGAAAFSIKSKVSTSGPGA